MIGHVFINGVEKYVKCAYIGVNGKAQYVLKPPGVSKYKTLNDGLGRTMPGSGSIANYALFVGGRGHNSNDDDIDFSDSIAYDSKLTKTTIGNISKARYLLTSANTPDYLIFSGGSTSPDGMYSQSNVDAYNKSLTRTTASRLTKAAYDHEGTSIGNYAIFAGGMYNSPSSDGYRQSFVNAYSNNLTRTSCSSLSVARNNLGAATTGNYAIFSSGNAESFDDSLYYDIYNNSLSKVRSEKGSVSMDSCCGVSFNNYALFIGAREYPRKVFCYNSSLTMINVADTIYKHSNSVATALNGHVLIFGDSFSDSNNNIVECYDSNLTLCNQTHDRMTYNAQGDDCLAITGKYAIFYYGSWLCRDTQDVFCTQ